MLPFQNVSDARLYPGQAITLRAHTASLLRIRQGRVWVTFTGPHRVVGRESGDQFLAAGDALRVPVGARMVLEPLSDLGAPQPVLFDWKATALPSRSEGFAQQVLAPARELGCSMAHTRLALQRLLRGLLGWSTGRPACCCETAQS